MTTRFRVYCCCKKHNDAIFEVISLGFAFIRLFFVMARVKPDEIDKLFRRKVRVRLAPQREGRLTAEQTNALDGFCAKLKVDVAVRSLWRFRAAADDSAGFRHSRWRTSAA